MYNEVLKRKFIDDFTNSEVTAASYATILNSLEIIESDIGKDLCQFSDDEAAEALDRVSGLRMKSKYAPSILFRSYSRWCVDAGIPGARALVIDDGNHGLEKIKTMMVGSPDNLNYVLDSIYDPIEDKTMDIVGRAYFWMAYIGVPENDVINISRSDVDIGSMIIRHNGVSFDLFEQAIPSIEMAANLTQFSYKHPNYGSVIARERVGSDSILRGVKSDANIKALRTENSRRINYLYEKGVAITRISFTRVRLSGIFYRTYAKEISGIEPDFSDAANEFMRGKTYNLTAGRNTVGAKKRRVIKEYMQDYDRWKKVFCV